MTKKDNAKTYCCASQVPQLRFPEFADVWNEKMLSELGDFVGGGTPDSTKKEYWKGNIPWISSSDIKENNVQEIDISRFITEEAINESATKIISKNSVLIVSRVGIGKFAVAKQDLCTSQDFTNLITGENSYFLAYYFKARSSRFVRLSQGTSIKGFTGKDIKKAKFAIPTPLEQTKIASFLTAVDKSINLLQKKKAELTQYKKGVIQKLFDVKADGCPDLRFKQDDGSDFPDWEEKKLGDVASFSKGKGISKADIANDGTTECIRYGELYTVYSEVISKIVSKTNIDENELVLSEENDVILPASGETQIDIATASCVEKSGIALGGDLNIIKSQIDGIFLSYYLNNARKRNIARLAQGISVVHLYASQLAILKIDLPYLREQTKIADFLSSIDKSIENIVDKIEQSQKWKQGLLQKMFV